MDGTFKMVSRPLLARKESDFLSSAGFKAIGKHAFLLNVLQQPLVHQLPLTVNSMKEIAYCSALPCKIIIKSRPATTKRRCWSNGMLVLSGLNL